MAFPLSFLMKSVSLLFLLGSTLLLLFIVMSGSVEDSPIDRFYWLQANTGSLSGAPAVARWTFWGLCGVRQGKNFNCSSLAPAYPLSPLDNFDNTANVPNDFISNRSTYFYLSRFSFCFFLIALAFIGMALIFYVLSWCSLTFTKTVFVTIVLGTLFNMAATACQTAVVVMAKDTFHDSDLSAKIGVKMMAFAWTTVALDILLFFITGGEYLKKAYRAHREFVELQNYKEQALSFEQQQKQQQLQMPQPPVDLETGVPLEEPQQPQEPHQSGIKFFKIRRTHKPDDESI